MNKYLFLTGLSLASIATAFLLPCTSAISATGSELHRMYEEDQKDRVACNNALSLDWKKVSAHDAVHRERVLQLLNMGKLRSGKDYYYAAMIMQHGNGVKDYMLAHVLASAAMKLGYRRAAWLSASSFDRLMREVGQPQVFGTQYLGNRGESWKLEPLAEDVVPDSVRKAFNVPTIAESKERLKQMNAE